MVSYPLWHGFVIQTFEGRKYSVALFSVFLAISRVFLVICVFNRLIQKNVLKWLKIGFSCVLCFFCVKAIKKTGCLPASLVTV
nr:MAG TPA: hypothetical protein [Caudoviricetes sp.]